MRRVAMAAMRAPMLDAPLWSLANAPLCAAWAAPRASAPLEAVARGSFARRGGFFRAVASRCGDASIEARRHLFQARTGVPLQARWALSRRVLSTGALETPHADAPAPSPALLAALGADPTPGPATHAPLRVVFFGNPQECLPVLSALLGASDRVALSAVVCSVGKPRGRGRKEAPPLPVEALARDAGVEVLRTSDAGRDLELAERLRALSPDLFVTAAFGGYLSKRLRAIPRCGTLNVHPSALPRLRGAAPVQRAIEAGDEELAVSVLYSVRAMDAGPVLAQAAWSVGDEQTYGVSGKGCGARSDADADAARAEGAAAGRGGDEELRTDRAGALARPAWAWGVDLGAWDEVPQRATDDGFHLNENADANAPLASHEAPAPKRPRIDAPLAGVPPGAPLSAPLSAPWTSLTSSQTIERLFHLGAAALLSRIDDVAAGSAFPRARAQDEAGATHAARLRGEEGRLDPASMTAAEASRHVRAFAGWPGSVLEVSLSGGKREKRERWKVLTAEVLRDQGACKGRVEDRAIVPSPDATRLLVPCRSGVLAICAFVVAGKKPTDATEYCRGLRGRTITWLEEEEGEEKKSGANE